MNPTKQFVIRLMASLLLLTSCALAQTSTTSLQGTVTDPSTAAVANATVDLVSAERQVQRTATTGSQGEYRFQFLPPGTYTIEAWHEKLGTMTQKITLGTSEIKKIEFVFKSRPGA